MRKARVLSGLACLSLVVFVLGARTAGAQSPWQMKVGGEPPDQSVQADAFFPNEIWINVGDSIQWTFVPKAEVHTVTLLKPGQERPLFAGPPVAPPPVGCDAIAGEGVAQASGVSYDGAGVAPSLACVNSGTMADGARFSVKFTKAGNYKLVCLIHTDMNGTVHVLPAGTTPPYNRDFYEDEGARQGRALLADSDRRRGNDPGDHAVIAGDGEIVATGGGTQYRASVRFSKQTVYIHEGDSVTWTNLDPTEPHTVTFGTEPANFVPTSTANLGANAADGTLTATIVCSTNPCDMAYEPDGDQAYSKTTFLSSGFIAARAPDRTVPGLGCATPAPCGDAQLPPGTTRITITFPKAGHYYYHCALHDVDGMVGEVVVQPKGDGDGDRDDQ